MGPSLFFLLQEMLVLGSVHTFDKTSERDMTFLGNCISGPCDWSPGVNLSFSKVMNESINFRKPGAFSYE